MFFRLSKCPKCYCDSLHQESHCNSTHNKILFYSLSLSLSLLSLLPLSHLHLTESLTYPFIWWASSGTNNHVMSTIVNGEADPASFKRHRWVCFGHVGVWISWSPSVVDEVWLWAEFMVVGYWRGQLLEWSFILGVEWWECDKLILGERVLSVRKN